MRIKPKKRLLRGNTEKPTVPETINDFWSIDFMHDSLENERRYRLFNVIDDFNRQGLGIEIKFSLLAEIVIRALDQITEYNGNADQNLYSVIMNLNI